MNDHAVWICYIAGAAAHLVWKLLRYLYSGCTRGVGWREALGEWFFEPTNTNAASWAASIAAIWLIGWVYIRQEGLFGLELPLPVNNAVAFALGVVIEQIAPDLAKWVTRKITSLTRLED